MKSEPKKYKAQTLPPKNPDPFVRYKTWEVTGYYIKHLSVTPPPIGNKEYYDEFEKKHTKHYIAFDKMMDWNLDQSIELKEIDINTLEEIEDED